MIRSWLRSLTIPWIERGARGALARTVAAAGDLAAGDARRALRQRLPITAADLNAHARNSMLRRRHGETDQDWRRRLAVAGQEMAQQGQVRDVRRRLDQLLGTGAWQIEEFPKDGFYVGDAVGDPIKSVTAAPLLAIVLPAAPPAEPQNHFRIGDSYVGGPDAVGGTEINLAPANPDLDYLIKSLDPDIRVVIRRGT